MRGWVIHEYPSQASGMNGPTKIEYHNPLYFNGPGHGPSASLAPFVSPAAFHSTALNDALLGP